MVCIMAKTTDVNPSITYVTIIEGLISQITGHIEAINPQNARQNDCKQAASAKIELFQEIMLFELRKAFE